MITNPATYSQKFSFSEGWRLGNPFLDGVESSL